MMSQEPITGVCIVEDKSRVPAGFEVISLTTDNYDADLWKDKKLRKKITRYLAFTRMKDAVRGDKVLGDLTVMKEDIPTPHGFTCITHTEDTKEVVLKKKCVIIRLVDRKDTNEAVMDIYITSGKSRSRPVESTARGWEIKDLALFLRYGPVVHHSPSNGPTPADLPYQYPVRQNTIEYSNEPAPSAAIPVSSPLYHRPTLTRQSTMRSPEHKAHMSGIDGVPFTLNPMLVAASNPDRISVPQLELKTREEILRLYEYDFSTERSVKRQAALTS